MPAEFFDTHAHLDYPDYSSDFEEILERARRAGITKIITIGTDLESSGRAVDLAERYPMIYAAVGWHPSYVEKAPDDIRPALRGLAKHEKVVAIGETGLDYHHLPSSKDPGGDDHAYKARQAELFRQHMEVATECGLNCIIHQRDAMTDTLTQMDPWRNRVRGVFHCFVGDPGAKDQVLGIGSLVSFTGIVTFKNAQTVRDTVAATNLDSFMLETDCPYLAPVPYRGKRCEPAYVKEIAETIARVKACSLDELSEKTCQTAFSFFPKLRN